MICDNRKAQLILEKYIDLLKSHPLGDTRERIRIAIKFIETNLLEGFKS